MNENIDEIRLLLLEINEYITEIRRIVSQLQYILDFQNQPYIIM